MVRTTIENLNISIQNAEITDAEFILNLQKKAYQTEAEIYQDWNIPPLTQTLDELIKAFDEQSILKAVINTETQDQRIVGSVQTFEESDVVQVGRLMVDPPFQGQGIGSMLLDAVEQLYPGQRLELFTGHLSQENLRLYQKRGYAIFKEEQIHSDLKFIYLYKVSPYKVS